MEEPASEDDLSFVEQEIVQISIENLHVCFVSSFEVKDEEKTKYRVVLRQLSKEIYSTTKTFDDFFQFKTEIRKEFGNKIFPSFPPRLLPGFETTLKDNYGRKDQFNDLLTFIMQDEQLRHSDVFSTFLGYKINFEGFIKEGFLWKEGAIVKSWKKRWFVLSKEYLSYYELEGDKVRILKGSVELNRVSNIEILNYRTTITPTLCITVKNPLRTYYIVSENGFLLDPSNVKNKSEYNERKEDLELNDWRSCLVEACKGLRPKDISLHIHTH